VHSGASVNAVTKSGTNRLSWQCVRIPEGPPLQCHESVCRHRS
jgi:hypothetical protein